VIPRPPVATLLASLAAHGGVLAILFFLVSGESHPSVLFIDLEAVAEPDAPVAAPESSPAAVGGNTKRASTGSARPAGRDGGRPGPASPSASATPLPSPLKAAALQELVREKEVTQSPPEEPPRPEPAVAIAPAREAAPDVAPRSEANASAAELLARSGRAAGEPTAPTSEPGAGSRVLPGTGTSGDGPGGAGGRTAVASGGAPGGAPGAEYGSYLATVRRRILDALRYPTPARSRGLTGTVYLEIFIKSDGAIGDVSVTSSSSHPLLDEAALEAVRSLAPQPFPKGLAPRPLRVRLPVVFDLQ
jgi:periplasmic protein TonB